MKKLVLLDGHAIIHRAFHAIRPLTTPAGELVNAVFGFTSMLLNVLEIEQPDCLAVAFDVKGKTFRHHADENYKATRTKTPDELHRQVGRVYEVVRAFSVPIFTATGFEADDVIATVAEKNSNEDLKIIVVSGDRDLLQLVNSNVSVHDLTGGYRQSINFDPAAVEQKFGFAPKFVPDFKGLSGDTSDNIPGVAGVGVKTATDLIQQFGHLEKIYENLKDESIRDSVRQKMLAGRDEAFRCRELATLRRDAPVEFSIDDCRLHDFERDEVLRLFEELNFKSLTRRFEKLFPQKKAAEFCQQSLF